MKYSNILHRVILVLILSAACSCKKEFLDLDNPQALSSRGTITDANSLTNAVNGVYDSFQSVNYYNRTFTLVPDLLGDNVFISRQNVGFYINYDNFSIPADDGYLVNTWATMYSAIVNANLAIAGGEALDGFADQSNIRQSVGEMYAARALAMFDLVRYFAQPYNFTADASHPGIPVITAPQTEIISPARNTVKQVYDQIIQDLTKSVSLMNAHKKNGYFSIAAAKALLAKVYLYKEDWANAESVSNEVITSEPDYVLLTNAAYRNSWANDFSSESLFEIENTTSDRPQVNGIGFFYEQGAYGDALATKDLYDTYAATDVRKSLIQVGSRGTAENPAYIVHKYPKGLTTQDDNIKVLRLSEVYLIRAEARAEQNEDNAAQADLNTIVQRADPTAAPIVLTGRSLVDRIILERRKELAFEGNRFFDLTRKKMNVNHIQSDKTTLITYPNTKFAMPIPQGEINVNPNI